MVSAKSSPDKSNSGCKTVALVGLCYFTVEPLTKRRTGFCHKYGFVWNYAAYAEFLRMIELGKPTSPLLGFPWVSQLDWGDGVLGDEGPTDHGLEQLTFLTVFNQNTLARWEEAYPHCILGKCQLVLRTSKQSLLPLLYTCRAPAGL